MYQFKWVLPIMLLALSSCATADKNTDISDVDSTSHDALVEPKLISKLPTDVETFSYDGYRYFEKAETGYTFRYTNPRKHRMADVYVYPVAEQNQRLDHDTLVLGSTRATIKAIGQAVSQGIYTNFNVVGAATRARGFRTVARVEATYLRDNLASYTLVYQTEYDGTLLKIRVSMPDNESNRSSGEWDRFAEDMFEIVVNNLDEERKNSIEPALQAAHEVEASDTALDESKLAEKPISNTTTINSTISNSPITNPFESSDSVTTDDPAILIEPTKVIDSY